MSAGNIARLFSRAAQEGQIPSVKAHTASVTLGVQDMGMIHTNRGAAAEVVFTLPTPGSDVRTWVAFYAVANQNLKVASTDLPTTFNNATADAVSFETASEIIGGAFVAVWDGSSWLIFTIAEETQTLTVTSA